MTAHASLFLPDAGCDVGAAAEASTPLEDSAAPAILHIDLADYAARATVTPAPAACPFPEDAMELTLLEAARACAAGDGNQQPRRELIAAALREAARQQWWRDQAEAENVRLGRRLHELREGRRQLLRVAFELAGYITSRTGCGAGVSAVLAYVRAHRPSLASAMREVGPLQPEPTTLNARIREEVARG